MRKVTVRFPMHRKDPETGIVKQIYATYEGTEVVVPLGDRTKNKTARLFILKNSKNEDYKFRISGNGQYSLTKDLLGDRQIAYGTMMDSVMPEIIV